MSESGPNQSDAMISQSLKSSSTPHSVMLKKWYGTACSGCRKATSVRTIPPGFVTRSSSLAAENGSATCSNTAWL